MGDKTSPNAAAGARRPVLLRDYRPSEASPPGGREATAVRVMHANGCGAFGTLTITHDITRYTTARIFSRVGQQTGVLARFSALAGAPGGAGGERDVHGFTMKFYTEEGNWDLVGSNSPVFFVRDPQKFAELMRAQRRDPRTGRCDASAMWDFWSRSPESLHQVTMLMSDRGRPPSPRCMNGYGGHTYSFWNDAGARHWVKFHVRTRQGHALPTGGEAESWQLDLCGAIKRGAFPRWIMGVQIMPEADAATTPYNPFDVTRVWPHRDYPLHEVGIVELNRNEADGVSDIELAAFSPSNVVPGIGFSPDRMLQARIFSYADAHRERLGAHYAALPVNRPKIVPPDAAEDGAWRFFVPGTGAADPPGGQRAGDDDYTQPGNLYRLMDHGPRELLFGNIAAAMDGVPQDIVERQLAQFGRADPGYGNGVARALAARRGLKKARGINARLMHSRQSGAATLQQVSTAMSIGSVSSASAGTSQLAQLLQKQAQAAQAAQAQAAQAAQAQATAATAQAAQTAQASTTAQTSNTGASAQAGGTAQASATQQGGKAHHHHQAGGGAQLTQAAVATQAAPTTIKSLNTVA